MAMRGSLEFPGDKSLSHRAAILAACADGVSTLVNYLAASDTMNTLRAMEALGVRVTDLGGQQFRLESNGVQSLKSPAHAIDCGNSGTLSRLLMGFVAGLENVTCVIDGDASLQKRPMRRVIDPLEKLGARFEYLREPGCLPVRVTGVKLADIKFTETLGSAQVKSAVILAALASGVSLELVETIPSRDHSENMLRFAGVDAVREGNMFRMPRGSVVQPREYKIWGDISSAAFFAVGASLIENSELLLRSLLLNPYRDAYLNVLRGMGAAIEILPQKNECGEKGGDVLVRSARLKGYTLAANIIPAVIDELPILTVAGAFAEGAFSYRNAKELRVKESDRIQIMVKNLNAVGAKAVEFEDGLSVEGNPHASLRGAIITEMDHRIVMSFEIANLVNASSLSIEGKEWVETSFPSFYEKLKSATSRADSAGLPTSAGGAPQIVTIDGPAGSGKSTVASMLAARLQFNQIDSGALYRALTFAGYGFHTAIRVEREATAGASDVLPWSRAVAEDASLMQYLRDIPLELKFSEGGRQHVFIDGRELNQELRSPEVAARIKPIADARYIREKVRLVLLAASKQYAIVADGRDMGTEVFTGARFKFFLTAASRVRAERRLGEFRGKNPAITLDEVERQIIDRDRDDATREFGGLRPADTAIFIDTSSHSQEQVVDIMLAYIRNSADVRAGSPATGA